MGNPLYSDDVGKMCFNAAKTWQLGWYNDKKITVDPLVNSDTSVTMVGVADYAVAGSNRYVVTKIETGTSVDLFVAFNRATGINSQNDQADDQVTIVETGNNGESYSQSFLKATLLQGQSYVATNFAGSGQDLTITATAITLSNTAGASQAVVNVKLGENVPPTKSPTKAPTDTPVAAPSKSPTKAPTGSPVAAPSKSPTNSKCPAGEKMLEVDILTDNYPGETTWNVKSVCDGGSTVLSGGPYSITGSTNFGMACVPEGRYTFEIKDSYGDGICCSYGTGAYTVKYGGAQVSSGGDFGSSKADTFGDECSSSKCPAGENPLTVTVNTDNYPSETSWELRTCSGALALSGSGYTSAGSTYSTSECVPDTSSYNFVIMDSWGDGICCSYGLGSYTVELGGAIVASGGAFGIQESKSIGSASCGNIPPNQPEPDCSDITKKNLCRDADTCNWNGNGNNGSCVQAPKPQDPAPQPKCEMCRATGLSCCGTCVFSGPKANRGCFA